MRRMVGRVARARAMQSRCCWPPDIPKALVLRRSLTSSQSAGLLEAVLDDGVQFGAAGDALEARSVGDVVVDRFWKRIGLLENQTDLLAKGNQVHFGFVNILAGDEQFTLDAAAGDEIVQAVDGTKKGGFAAPAGADHGNNAVSGHGEGGGLDGLMTRRKRR